MKAYQKKIIEYYVRSYNYFDIDGMTNDLDDNIIFENIANGAVNLQIEGILDFKKQAIKASNYFIDRKQTILNWHPSGDTVIIDIDYTATAAMDLPNGIKKGQTIELKGQSEFTFKNQKIIQIRDIS